MRLTTARYYTPSGRSIQAKGIDPDIVVEPAKVEEIKNNYERMSEADLPGALDKAKQTAPAPAAATTPPPAGTKPADLKTPDGKPDKEEERKKRVQADYQLARALDLVRGVTLYEQRLK